MSTAANTALSPLVAFASRLRSASPAFVAWTGVRESMNIEVMLRSGCDGVVLDWQHGPADAGAIAEGIQTAFACGKGALVRVGLADVTEAARFLDWGAAGVIVPMINSAAEAQRLVRDLKYAPLGERSYGPIRAAGMAGMSAPEYFAKANAHTLIFVMIETRAGLAALDEILGIEGIDGVLVGPSDLCIALTHGAVVDPLHKAVDAALDTVLAGARKAGKLAAAFCPSGARAGELARRGYNLVSLPTEQMLLRQVTTEELRKAREIFSA